MNEENKDNENKVQKSEIALSEERVLEFWNKSNTFEKSEAKDAPNGPFVFYDGPPFATGTPHFGHILAGTIKDAIPRYQTMKGKKVIRKWGWDCHGLPMENIIEAELGLENKKDIEDFGIEKFNESANSKVLRFADYWEKVIPRLGRWVDMDNSYRTMDTTYTESVWWSFNEIYKKGLIYEGFKSMHYCPRCGTTLSNFEVNQGYKDIKDLSVTAEFELEDEPNTFVLAWTTTPWTLPGNMALAVNPKETYVKIEKKDEGNGELVRFILAKAFLEKIFKDSEYKIIDEFDGVKIVGKKYKPVFDYYVNEDIENKENAWKIYGADFVTMEDGTGIVHLAPAFGDDDLKLAQKEGIPIVHHVDLEGKFKKEVKDFAGIYVKQKGDHQATDVEIIKYLAGKGVLFSKEKIEHSYPHCWRCDTPLLNYATSSWFLETTKIKDKVISENKAIRWVPENIRDGRMGKWLEGMRDWAISRSRYWGAPLPVWKCEDCDKLKVIGSIDEIREENRKNGSQNKYFVIRHGEAENNTLDILSSKIENPHHLTEVGKEQVLKSAKELKSKKIDIIFTSPFVRTKETTEIIAKELGIKEIIEDKRLGEVNFGELEGQKVSKYLEHLEKEDEFNKSPKDGENLLDIKNRLMEFFYEIDEKYSDKNICIVSHETPSIFMYKGLSGLKNEDLIKEFTDNPVKFNNAEFKESNFEPIPHNRRYELDLHRPYIDDVEFKCTCGGKMKIIKEVFDCWYESGSMPYASKHYPFENLDLFNPEKGIGYPANFIAEGLDQTRGWFYSMLILSVALFDKAAYQNVIVNGLVMAEDGQKMSKSKKNFSDPMDVVNKFSADAVRYYLLASPLMKAEDLNFTEKGVDEVLKKNILRFKNVLSFYELYKDTKKEILNPKESTNILDQWILTRLNELSLEVSDNMDNYEIDKATRPISEFIDDLSTWYLRRSRDRFKMSVNSEELIDSLNNAEQTLKNAEIIEDKDFAIATTKFVLENLAKVYAPFMPFIAEEIWQKVTENNFGNPDKSVHLESWLEVTEDMNKNILEEMKEVRDVISLGLEIRAKEGIKVRQPLNELKIKNEKLKMKKDLSELIKDELNVKKVSFNENFEEEIELDLGITLELEKEGDFREFLRNIQIFRKDSGLQAQDEINLAIKTDDLGKELLEKFSDELKRVAGVKEISFTEVSGGKEIIVKKYNFKIKIN
ncbi:class I tRNA ligase family protein [Patescibacteria group bacterium]|nr:class I tRNA ligase family protein [Patescibacteria group bacterium]